MTLVLDVRDLTKRFTMRHLGQALGAFAWIGFQLRAGEFHLLCGPNALGKSTLLRTLYCSYLANAGHIWYHAEGGRIDLARAADIDVTHLRRREIGFVTQFLEARPRVSAEALVAEPLRRAGRPVGAALMEARHWLAAFDVRPDLCAAYPTTYAGGEQQKVNLARALILPQRQLRLDEPTASLDAGARTALLARLAEPINQGGAMIGVFHHPGDVKYLIARGIDLAPAAKIQKERHDVAL